MKEFSQLIEQKEDLHPDLVPHLIKIPNLGVVLKHPLVFGVPYIPQMNAIFNVQYEQKKARVEQARKEFDHHTFIWFHERPYRFQAFDEVRGFLHGAADWELLGSIWTDSENLWQIPNLRELLTAPKRHREQIMSLEEQDFLKALPNTFRIYRGCQSNNRSGFSWTLNRYTAEWFARRLSKLKPVVVSALVEKKDVIAYFSGRNESEIVVDPLKLKRIQKVNPIKREDFYGDRLEKTLEACKAVFVLKDRTDHGPSHWEKVEHNVIALVKKTKGADMLVCRLFAICHDCKRENEYSDPGHGQRAADFAISHLKEWGFDLNPKQTNTLYKAIQLHNDGQVSDNPTIGCCWDADRLDLFRVGIVPNVKLMSTEAGKSLIWKI